VDGQTQPIPPIAASLSQVVPDPPPSIISVIQQKNADEIKCDANVPGVPVGRIVAVFFSEEVTPASVQDGLLSQDITAFAPETNRAVGVALQPGRRIAFVAMRDPLGPFVPRQMTVQDVVDRRGQVMAPWTGLMEPTVSDAAAVVSGRILEADGTPIPFATSGSFYWVQCGSAAGWRGISAKSAGRGGPLLLGLRREGAPGPRPRRQDRDRGVPRRAVQTSSATASA
jgi:hypothetical protein